MRYRLVVSMGSSFLLTFAACLQAAEPAVELSAVTDRPDAMLGGPTGEILISAKKAGQPVADGEVVCILDKDGMPPTLTKTVKLLNGTATVEGTLDEPGFLRCRATCGATGKSGPWQWPRPRSIR